MKNFVRVDNAAFNTAGLLPAYQAVNPTGFVGACSILRLVNNSNSSVAVSFDGVNDADQLRPNSDVVLNFQANASPNNDMCYLSSDTVVYVSSAAANAGSFSVSCYYQVNY